MEKWGNAMYVTPGVVVDGQLVTTSLVDINLGIRILLGSSYYQDWDDGEMFVEKDPLGNKIDRRHPWNQTTIPKPQKRDFKGKYTWVMSPRWLDRRTGDHLALDTGGGPLARLWATALAGKVDFGYVQGHRQEREDQLAEDGAAGRNGVRMEDPAVEQYDRTRSGTDLFPGLRRRGGPVFRRAGPARSACRADEDLHRFQACRTRPSAAASTRPCAACSRTTW